MGKSLPAWCESKGIDYHKFRSAPNWTEQPELQEYYKECDAEAGTPVARYEPRYGVNQRNINLSARSQEMPVAQNPGKITQQPDTEKNDHEHLNDARERSG